MGLTSEAEKAMERSMRKEQEERKRQAEQRENNEHLTKMLAKEIQAHPSHQYNDIRIPALERRIAELERMVGALSSQAHDTYRSDSGIIEPDYPLDGVKFSLMRVVVDNFLRGWGCYIAPQKPEEFTAPQSLDTYPGGLLEYIVQCGRKNGFPHNRIAANTTLGIHYCDNELWVEDEMIKIMDFIVRVLSTSHTMETGEASPNAGPFNVRM